MSGKKISELSALTIVAEGDTLPIVDISGSVTGKVAVGDLLTTQFPGYTVWNTIVVPMVGRAAPGGSGNNPTLKVFQTDGSGSPGVYQYAWPTGSDKWLYFSAQLPSAWKIGTSLHPILHWATIAGGAGDVVWGIEYTIAAHGGTFGSTVSISCACSASAAYMEEDTEFSTIGMTAQTLMFPTLLGRIYREGTDVADTYASDAFGQVLDFRFEVDSIGSASEDSK